jgi:hypothetical protein
MALASGGGLVAEPTPVYRPRHPERTAFYQVLDEHFSEYMNAYEERYEARSGPLRRVVQPTVEAFLDCGRLIGGFARLRCPKCRGEHLLAFSCQTRNFCASCQAKRAALFAEKLVDEILEPVPHRHWVFTIPKVLRGLIQRERRLLGILSRSAFDAVAKAFQARLGRRDLRPGAVASLQTFGAFGANFHPHVHALVSDGAFTPDGAFLPLPTVDLPVVEELFRRLVLLRLHQAERLSETFLDSLLSWVHSGFSVYAKQVVLPDDPAAIERLACYLVRAPMPQSHMEKGEGELILLRTPPDPRTGATQLELDPLDWIHAITQQIPDRGQHLVRYFGWYANRTRGSRRRREGAPSAGDGRTSAPPLATSPPRAPPSATRASWARLLRKILEVDPLLCPTCQVELKIVAVLTEPRVVDRILRHRAAGRGHDPLEPRAPPPA